MRGLFLCLLLCGFGGAALFADEITLKDGRKITGKVTEDDDHYIIRGETSTLFFPKIEVLRVEKKLTPTERYENLRAITPADNVAELLQLAKWCRQNNLPRFAREHYAQILLLEPNNHEARRGLGYVFYNDEWLSREDHQRAIGKELYKGEWLDRAEVERRLAKDRFAVERDANQEKIHALLSAARKLRADEKLTPLAQSLAAITGAGVWRALEVGLIDHNPKIREVIYLALGLRSEPERIPLLLKHFRAEDSERLVKIMASILAAAQPPEAMVEKMMEQAIRSSSRRSRQRAGLVIRLIGDPRVIDTLIEVVDFCPVTANNAADNNPNANNDSANADGWETSTDKRPRKPYYPAHELLQYLTGQTFKPTEGKLWEKWWRENRETFDFSAVVSAPGK